MNIHALDTSNHTVGDARPERLEDLLDGYSLGPALTGDHRERAGGSAGLLVGHGASTPARDSDRASSGHTASRVRVAVRLHPDTNERARYWADRSSISVNEYIVEAVEEKIRRENQDYDLPTLEIARLNQLVDEMASLSRNVGNLERVTVTGFDSLIGLTRGDNYLLDDEDGDIGTTHESGM